MGNDCGLVHAIIRKADDSVDLFAPFFVRDAYHGAFYHRLVLINGVFDFCRIDVFPAGNNHILHSIHYIDKAFVIHAAAITGVEPAGSKGLCRQLGLIPITEHDVFAPGDDLADRPPGDFIIIFVKNPNLATRDRQAG